MKFIRNPLVIAGVALFLIVVFIAGLLLPPISLGQRLFSRAGFTELTSDAPSLSLEQGLTISVDPSALPSGFTMKLDAIPNGTFLGGQAGQEWETAALRLPSFLSLTGPVFTVHIAARNEMPSALNLTITIPSNAQPYETLDLYAWDGERWVFLPSLIEGEIMTALVRPERLQPGNGPSALVVVQTGPAVPLTGTLLEAGHSFGAEPAATLNMVAPAALSPAPDGTLVGALAGGYELDQGYAVTPVIRNHTGNPLAPDISTLTAILTDPRLQDAHIQSVVDFTVGDNYDGVVLDYRGVDPVQRSVFSTLITNLASKLHGRQKTLALVLPTPDYDGTSYNTGGYDWDELGYAADLLMVPVAPDPAAAGNGDNDRLFGWAVRRVNRYKIQLLTSSLGTAQPDGGAFVPLDYPTALQAFGTASLAPGLGDLEPGDPVSVTLSGRVESLDFDSTAFAPRITYLDGGGIQHTGWFGTPDSMLARFGPVQKYHLGGVTVIELLNGGNMPGVVNALSRYRANQAAAGAAPLTLIWTVNLNGQAVAQATGMPGAPFIWPANQPGPYEIGAALQGPAVAALGSVALTVPAETATLEASPIGSPAPTRTPGPTATPCPTDCPTATVPPPTTTLAPAVINPGASGPFQLGGQAVHGGITYSADMKRAGMTWVKLQADSMGVDFGPAIANAKAMGFNILVSVVDKANKNSITSPAYQQSYGQYLAGIAAQGADAIEVWNEPNIDREWPTGQVNGASFSQLLKTVYPMIKAANPNTMVISGAPAPTGYFGGGCAPQGCNDDIFLQQVASAGGANYLDCVGIHFNSGTTSPSATTGSALSGYHYSYYFWPMINTYRSAFQNARQLCFTELGYLSGEGYSPSLGEAAPSFSWASGISVGQQAAWLAEAAALSRDSGVVRLLIVFNVDYTIWGADPQAGYAIIRPGNACPACDALDAVMP